MQSVYGTHLLCKYHIYSQYTWLLLTFSSFRSHSLSALFSVLNRLHELSYDIAHHDYDEDNKGSFNPTPQQRAAFFQQLNNQINILCASFGTMERIKNTPLPFVYVIHLRSILLLYLFLWNMTSIASIGWVALPALFAFNLSMLGIEAASVECERPFDWNSNHLTMGKFCILIARNIAQAMKEIRY